jgi:hypothetical protein
LAIWALNKKMPDEWGQISDLQLERENSNIKIHLNKDDAEAIVAVQGYQIDMHQGETRLSWKKISVSGSQKSWYLKRIGVRKHIVIPPMYVALVEKLDKKRQLTATTA